MGKPVAVRPRPHSSPGVRRPRQANSAAWCDVAKDVVAHSTRIFKRIHHSDITDEPMSPEVSSVIRDDSVSGFVAMPQDSAHVPLELHVTEASAVARRRTLSLSNLTSATNRKVTPHLHKVLSNKALPPASAQSSASARMQSALARILRGARVGGSGTLHRVTTAVDITAFMKLEAAEHQRRKDAAEQVKERQRAAAMRKREIKEKRALQARLRKYATRRPMNATEHTYLLRRYTQLQP